MIGPLSLFSVYHWWKNISPAYNQGSLRLQRAAFYFKARGISSKYVAEKLENVFYYNCFKVCKNYIFFICFCDIQSSLIDDGIMVWRMRSLQLCTEAAVHCGENEIQMCLC